MSNMLTQPERERIEKEFEDKFGDFFIGLTKAWIKFAEWDKEIDITVPLSKKEKLKSFMFAQIETILEKKIGEIKEVWREVQFLDHYDESNDDYWSRRKGDFHVVSMHVSDFDRLRKIFTLPDRSDRKDTILKGDIKS